MAIVFKSVIVFFIVAVIIQKSTGQRRRSTGETCYRHRQCASNCCVIIRGPPAVLSNTKHDLVNGELESSTCQPKGKLGDKCHMDQQPNNADNDYCGKCEKNLQCSSRGYCIESAGTKS